MANLPTAAERFFFETQGYLVLENFLAADHVARLLAALDAAVARRRTGYPAGYKAVWPPKQKADLTQVHGEKSTRILNILEDDALFRELLDWPALQPYVHAFCNRDPHYCASDAIVEETSDFLKRTDGWHIDGCDNGYRSLSPQIPLLQLKVGYYLTDMSRPWRGNLTVVPGSHLSRAEPAPEERRKRELFPGAVSAGVRARRQRHPFSQRHLAHRRALRADRARPPHALLRLRASVDDGQHRALGLQQGFLQPAAHARTAPVLPRFPLRSARVARRDLRALAHDHPDPRQQRAPDPRVG